jgi:2-polyprenyl-3-methyl-5-hydroxy-6-metoxy-1,4-benzoquinol methylase
MVTVSSAYSDATWFQRILVATRPLICPPEPILASVPAGGTVLDVGCGVGALLISLAIQEKLSSGTGCDVNAAAIAFARKAASHVPGADLQFLVTESLEEIPRGPFEVVMLVDVMHHVNPSQQQRFFAVCADRLRAGGRLIYKDMADRPLWKNLFNRLHDAVIAREFIYYVPLQTIKDWGDHHGLCLEQESAYSRFAYEHELLVFQKVHRR